MSCLETGILDDKRSKCILFDEYFRSPEDCDGLCGDVQGCTHWTWTSGTCHLKSGRFWEKTPSQGAISGIAGHKCVKEPVRGWWVIISYCLVDDWCAGRECGYDGTKDRVQCIFADHR